MTALGTPHRLAMLVEGIRIPEPLVIFDVTVTPLPDLRLDEEVPEILSALLEHAGFVTEVDPVMWAVSSGPRRPLLWLVTPPAQLPDGIVYGELRRITSAILDVLVILYGGAARHVGAVLEVLEDTGWRHLMTEVGGPPWPVSQLQFRAPDGYAVPPVDENDAFHELGRRPQLALWSRLYSGVASEGRHDVRLFRLWSLLEAIASECVASGSPVVDADGKVLINAGEPATTSRLRGRVFALLQSVQAALAIPDALMVCHPDHSLWSEVGVWKDVRDIIAHEGTLLPVSPRSTNRGRQRRVTDALNHAARPGGTWSEGLERYASHLMANTEAVLRAVLVGRIKPRASDEDGAPAGRAAE